LMAAIRGAGGKKGMKKRKPRKERKRKKPLLPPKPMSVADELRARLMRRNDAMSGGSSKKKTKKTKRRATKTIGSKKKGKKGGKAEPEEAPKRKDPNATGSLMETAALLSSLTEQLDDENEDTQSDWDDSASD